MIDFSKYIGEWLVLVTNFVPHPEQLSGIRISDGKLFKYHNKWVIVRQLNKEDVDNEDYIDWLTSMWGKDEHKLKLFLRYKVEELRHHEETYCTADVFKTRKN